MVVLEKKWRYLFGAVLSPFSTLAKSSAVHGRLDFFS